MAVAMDSQEARRRMEEGRLYLPGDEAIMAGQMDCLEKQYDSTPRALASRGRRAALLREMFARSVKTVISSRRCTPTGAAAMCISSGVYANFNLTLVDDAHIYVGDCVMFGAQCHGGHGGASPVDPRPPAGPRTRRRPPPPPAARVGGRGRGHPAGRDHRG
ncbi:MAG: hypothetical protein V8T36_09405 [Ruthenibacterium lactatiformans]